jgi:hypothetical protein
MDSNTNEPMLFALQDCEFKTNLACNPTTFPDRRILRNAKNSSFTFGDGRRLQIGDQTIALPISKNIGVRGQTTDLFRIHMPTYIANLGAFSVSVNMEGTVTNAIAGGAEDPSADSFKTKFNVANAYNAQSITVSSVTTTNDTSASTNISGNLVAGVVITAVPDNTNNWVTVSARPNTAGADNAAVLLRAKAKLIWSGGYRDTILIENL